MIPEQRPKRSKRQILHVGGDMEDFKVHVVQVSVVKTWTQIAGEFALMAAAAFVAAAAAYYIFPSV
jgi:hypothetical protein